MKNIPSTLSSMHKVYWYDIRKVVRQVNLEMANIIDAINPDIKYPLYLLSYPYGTCFDDGYFKYPLPNGELVHLDHPDIHPDVKLDFNYAGLNNPMGVVLEKVIEYCWDFKGQSIPSYLHSQGTVFAISRLFEFKSHVATPYAMSIYAGARNIAMGPNIADSEYHKYFERELGLMVSPPNSLRDHWQVFKGLSDCRPEDANWKVTLMLFTKPWIDSLSQEPLWLPLRAYLLDQDRRNNSPFRNKVFYDHAFSKAQKLANLNANPYLVDVIKHVFSIALGQAIGFAPAVDDSFAPVRFIQTMYCEKYRMRDQIPTIFEPTYFDPSKNRPVYFCWQYPTLFDFSPSARKATIIRDMCELRHIHGKIMHTLDYPDMVVEKNTLGEALKNIHFEYFHSRPDKTGLISSTLKMPNQDPALLHYHNEDEIKRAFAHAGEMLRGCIRISSKKNI